MNRGLSVRFSNYKSFSSSVDDINNKYEWQDFEKIFHSISKCLVRALPGLDDISIEDDNESNTIDTPNFLTDENIFEEMLSVINWIKLNIVDN
jgi:hypothetical protein